VRRALLSGTVVEARHRRAYLVFFWLILAVGLLSIGAGVALAMQARATHGSPLLVVAAVLIVFGIVRIANAVRHIRLFAARRRPSG
jgi:uncharacterized membrane protein HdeD (DUF308 family)